MGGGNQVYRIYRGAKRHFLLRAGLPTYSNASVPAEDKSYAMLEEAFTKLITDEIGSGKKLTLVGESEEICPDDEFYQRAKPGAILPLCFAHYKKRKPWCVFAIAKSGPAFWKKFEKFEDFDARDFVRPAIRIEATYLESTDGHADIEVEEIGGRNSGVNRLVKRGAMMLFMIYGLYRIFSGYLNMD